MARARGPRITSTTRRSKESSRDRCASADSPCTGVASRPRFSPEDFQLKSSCGVGDDWPITYEDLDPFYQEAEERMGVSGEQGPADIDPRGKPFPLPKLPLSYNLEKLHGWVSAAGIPMWSQPSAKNSVPYKGRSACCRNDTCTPICPDWREVFA